MDITKSIEHLLPLLIFGTDYEVLDDSQGEGPYIKWYNKEIKQPTQEELETAWIEVEKEMNAEILKQEKSEQIAQIASLSDQLNLLASCIEVLAEGNTDPRLEYARSKFNDIKSILSK